MPGWGELFVEEVVDKCGEVRHVHFMDNDSSSMFIRRKLKRLKLFACLGICIPIKRNRSMFRGLMKYVSSYFFGQKHVLH